MWRRGPLVHWSRELKTESCLTVTEWYEDFCPLITFTLWSRVLNGESQRVIDGDIVIWRLLPTYHSSHCQLLQSPLFNESHFMRWFIYNLQCTGHLQIIDHLQSTLFLAGQAPAFQYIKTRVYAVQNETIEKRSKSKMPDCAWKECSNQKVEENKSDLELNFTMEFRCPERILNNSESQRALINIQ